MSNVQPIRPPPQSAHLSPAPDDFDADMAARWHAWQVRGHDQSQRTKVHARGVFSLAGLAGVAAVVRHVVQHM